MAASARAPPAAPAGGSLPSAQALCEKALAKCPRSTYGYLHLGLCYQRTGQLRDAMIAFTEALKYLQVIEAAHSRTGVGMYVYDTNVAARQNAELRSLINTHIGECELLLAVNEYLSSSGDKMAPPTIPIVTDPNNPDEKPQYVNKHTYNTMNLEAVEFDVGAITGVPMSECHSNPRFKELSAQILPAHKARLWNQIAVGCLRTGRASLAEDHLEAIVRTYPRYLDAASNLGVVAAHLGRHAKAARCLQSVLLQDGGHVDALSNYAVHLLQHGRPHHGTRLLARAAAADALVPHVWANLASAHRATGRSADARRCQEAALSLNPACLLSRHNLALLRLQEAAMVDMDGAEGGEGPQPVGSPWARVHAELALAEADMAAVVADTMQNIVTPMDTMPSNRVWGKGCAAVAWGGMSEILKAQMEAAAAAGGRRGRERAGRCAARADMALRHALALAPDEATLWHQAALLRAHTDRLGGALEMQVQAVARAPWAAPSWCNLGALLAVAGRGREAMRALHRALEVWARGPASAEVVSQSVRNNLAEAHRRQGQLEEARRELAAAAPRDGEDGEDLPAAANTQGILLLHGGDGRGAAAAFGEAGGFEMAAYNGRRLHDVEAADAARSAAAAAAAAAAQVAQGPKVDASGDVEMGIGGEAEGGGGAEVIVLGDDGGGGGEGGGGGLEGEEGRTGTAAAAGGDATMEEAPADAPAGDPGLEPPPVPPPASEHQEEVLLGGEHEDPDLEVDIL